MQSIVRKHMQIVKKGERKGYFEANALLLSNNGITLQNT